MSEPNELTPEALHKILTDKSSVDPWWESNFFQPLLDLQETSEKRYCPSEPPKQYLEAREFAQRLWECCDHEDMRALVATSQEGAAQFCYMMSLFVVAQVLPNLDKPGEIEPKDDKPFAAIAARALAWLDDVEKQASGKTRRHQ